MLLQGARSANLDLFRAYYYHCLPYCDTRNPDPRDLENQRKKRGFFDFLNRNEFTVREGHVVFRGHKEDGTRITAQKGADVRLAIDIVQLSLLRSINTAVVLTGDGDLLPAIQLAKNNGVHTILWHGPWKTVGAQLWGACDETHEITRTLIDSMLLEPRKPRKQL